MLLPFKPAKRKIDPAGQIGTVIMDRTRMAVEGTKILQFNRVERREGKPVGRRYESPNPCILCIGLFEDLRLQNPVDSPLGLRQRQPLLSRLTLPCTRRCAQRTAERHA